MNIIFLSILFFIAVFLFLSWFARQKTKKIAKGVRNTIVILSLLVAIIFAIGNKILLSLPLFFLAVSALKIKGLGLWQILLLYRFLNQLRSTGRYSFNQNNETRSTSDLSINEAYKILGIKRGAKKEEVIKAANSLQKKIHPDMGNKNSEYLSKLVNSAKDVILKTDFS
tara:strand:- start:258 stop:764 length:507 start_codon:yes stop_codon:yes gene_type:complete